MGWVEGKEGVPLGKVKLVGQEVHWVSFVFAAWAMAMVSKTLHVPKP
jgi:CDP-diacylglycerol--serine O-phosphatidyltransferase